jgi:hypothetical protein
VCVCVCVCVCVMLGIKPGASYILSKCSPTEPLPSPKSFLKWSISQLFPQCYITNDPKIQWHNTKFIVLEIFRLANSAKMHLAGIAPSYNFESQICSMFFSPPWTSTWSIYFSCNERNTRKAKRNIGGLLILQIGTLTFLPSFQWAKEVTWPSLTLQEQGNTLHLYWKELQIHMVKGIDTESEKNGDQKCNLSHINKL